MRKFFITFLLFLTVASLEAKTHVLVSIAPQKFLVERIGGEQVSVEVIVPAGASSHTYEPTPRQMISVQKGDIWFRLGESFEKRLIPALKNNTHIVDQRDGIELITGGKCCQTHDSHDPHIWLSPRLLKQQATQIADTLSQKMPEYTEFFEENVAQLLKELDQLDVECSQLVASASQKLIMVSHPAFGYFCRDYGYQQLSIEMEGKEPTPRYLTEILFTARTYDVQTIFLQEQSNAKGGKKIAKELGAKTVYLNPYAENVIENLRTIAKLFANK